MRPVDVRVPADAGRCGHGRSRCSSSSSCSVWRCGGRARCLARDSRVLRFLPVSLPVFLPVSVVLVVAAAVVAELGGLRRGLPVRHAAGAARPVEPRPHGRSRGDPGPSPRRGTTDRHAGPQPGRSRCPRVETPLHSKLTCRNRNRSCSNRNRRRCSSNRSSARKHSWLTSDSESFGVAAVEASACGKPVVASEVGGLPEVVEHGVTGFLVPPRDPVKTADAIERLILDRSLRDRMGLAGRLRVEKLFRWDNCVDQMISIYRDTLNRTAGVPM